jgi:hypothetical protein
MHHTMADGTWDHFLSAYAQATAAQARLAADFDESNARNIRLLAGARFFPTPDYPPQARTASRSRRWFRSSPPGARHWVKLADSDEYLNVRDFVLASFRIRIS